MPVVSRKIVVALVVLGLAVVALGVVPLLVDVDRFRPSAEARLSEAIGRPVSLGPLRLALWTGPVIVGESLKLAGEPAFEAGRARIRLAVLPLFRGDVRPRVVRLEDARLVGRGLTVLEDLSIRCVLDDQSDGTTRMTGRARGVAPAFAGRPRTEVTFDATIGSDVIEVAHVSLTAGRNSMEASGRLDGVGTGRTRITIRGDVRAAGATIAGIDGRGGLESGDLRFEAASFTFHGGDGAASARIATSDPDLPFQARTRLARVRIADLLGAAAPRLADVLDGTASATLDVSGSAASSDIVRSVVGTGRIEIVQGSLKSVGIVKQAAQILELAGGSGIGKDETPFERVAATFAFEAGGAHTDDLEFRSTDLDLDGGGVVGLDGTLGLEVVAAFSPTVSAGIVEKTPQLRFRMESSGRLTLPMKIRGTLAAPLVQIDVDRILREGLRDELRRTRGRWLRDIIGRE